MYTHHYMIKPLVPIKLLAWVFFPLLLHISCGNDSQSEATGEQAHTVLSVEVQERDLSDIRTVSAPVVAYQRIYITARTAGQVLEVNFEEGQQVNRGQIMARLDTRKQQSQLRNAMATLREAEQHFARQKVLYEEAVITPAEFENATLTLEQAKSEVEFWQTEVELGEIRAPINAMVAAKLVEPGTSLNANDRLFTIEDHNLLVVRPALSEMDVAQLKEGQKLELLFDVIGETPYPGTIRRIFPSADNITRLFTVEVEIHQDKIPYPLRPGYLARARFTIDARANVLAAPPEAIAERDEKSVIFIIKNDNTIEKRHVETGTERDGWTEIVSGVKKGEKLATGNLNRLNDGEKVKVSGSFRRYGFRD